VPVYRLDDLIPEIHPDAFVHPEATVIGRVQIGAGSSIWPGAVLRGDFGAISVGTGTSIQDGSVLHAGPRLPTVVGDRCVIGHLVHLEGCTVEEGALVGSGAIVLHQARIGTRATVGAAALVPGRTVVPPDALAIGVPAVIRPGASHADEIEVAAEEYVTNARRYAGHLRRLD